MPARTPVPVITRLHSEVAAIARLPDIRERLAADGTDAIGNSPTDVLEVHSRRDRTLHQGYPNDRAQGPLND